MTKRQLEKVRERFENLDLSRYHILTYDGTEVTITQGDIDWAQDYCDAHGIDWSRSGEEEAKANDGAKEGGQAAIAENQIELENYDFSDETNDNYSREKAEKLKAEEENLQAASNEKENASVSAESNKAARNESKENVFTHIEKSIGDFYGKAKNFFGGFFDDGKSKNKGKACVENQTSVTILIKLESRNTPYTLLKAGDSYKGLIDGVIFPDDTVFKTNGNSKYAIKRDENGLYKVSGGETRDSIGNFVKSALNRIKNSKANIFNLREEDMYGTYSYATASAPFLEDWLNANHNLDMGNNISTSFVPIPRNLDGSVPPASFTLSRWNEFLK